PERSSPTVIVSRQVPADSEDAFASWVASLVNAAYRFPGYVDSFVQRPTSSQPNEWTVVYRFVDGDALAAWLSSDVRLQLIAEGRDLIDGEAREQVLAGVPSDAEARVVSSYKLEPGREGEHLIIHKRMLDTLASFRGFEEREILDAVDGIQDETVVILTFDTPDNLRSWLDSPERAAILGDLDAITVGSLTTNVVGGFAGWFPHSGATEPRKWKQALVVLGALFPVSLTVALIRAWALPNLPLVPSVLLGNIVGVAVLTWLLMPPLTKALDGWLRR
ncbi:MAG: antibiotic biosynthesis monooxygenase, partial [Acidimicrobiia bacterium]